MRAIHESQTLRAVYDGGVFRAAGPVDLPDGAEVELTVRPLPRRAETDATAQVPLSENPTWRALEAIWARRKARGAVPRTVEDIDADLAQQRREWDEREQMLDEARKPSSEDHAP